MSVKYARFTCLAIVVLMLSACGTPKPLPQFQAVIPANSPLSRSLDAGAVTSDVTNAPGWRSGTWASDARITLQEMLKANGLLAEQGARYDINATLISLVAPTSGIEMDCSMTIRYQVIREADQQVAMDETVDATYTATFGDATVGAVRARLAVEGATRKNFAAFLEKLVAANPSVFGTPRI